VRKISRPTAACFPWRPEKLGFRKLVEETLTIHRIPRAMTIYQFLVGMVLAIYVGFSRLNHLRKPGSLPSENRQDPMPRPATGHNSWAAGPVGENARNPVVNEGRQLRRWRSQIALRSPDRATSIVRFVIKFYKGR
jgi:hypothetical protein